MASLPWSQGQGTIGRETGLGDCTDTRAWPSCLGLVSALTRDRGFAPLAPRPLQSSNATVHTSMMLVTAGCRPCSRPVSCPLSPPSTLPLQPFIAMMLDNDQGLYYTNYGPADQGIMNKVGG